MHKAEKSHADDEIRLEKVRIGEKLLRRPSLFDPDSYLEEQAA